MQKNQLITLIPFFFFFLGRIVFSGRWEIKDFQYDISRFWEKYGRETVFSTLDGAGNYKKNNEKSELVIIKNGILIFGHLFLKNYFLLFTLVRYLEHLKTLKISKCYTM